MALPFSPRTTFDLIYDFNDSSNRVKRSFNDGTTNGKHICIIGWKTTIDTGPGLAFYDCQSVTIIGGYFRPNANGWGRGGGGNYGTGSYAPGLLTFTGIKEGVYLEGVVTDNINLYVDNPSIGENGGDAIYLAGKDDNTSFVAQNCHFANVRGTQDPAQAHGDVFQTASNGMGAVSTVDFFNCTASCDYQGFFTDPQATEPSGQIGKFTLRRVNIKRTRQVTPYPRLSFILSSQSNWDARGYPVVYDDFWVDGGGTQTLENTIWPNHEAGSNSLPVKYRASYGTETVNGVTRRFAEYKGLQDTGKAVSGKIYQGSPPNGDFCPINLVGLNYVQGTELSSSPSTPSTPTTPTTPTTVVGSGGTGGLIGNSWVKTGPGTLSNSPGFVSIISDGTTYTSASQEVTVNPGKKHRFSYNGESQTFSRKLGAVQDGSEYLSLSAGVIGANIHEFTPSGNKVFIQFQRLSSNLAVAKDLRLVDLEPANRAARLINGSSQYFYQDNKTNGYSMINSNLLIGAWWNFNSIPTAAGHYIYDFGINTSASTGGTGRIRLIHDVVQNRLVASNQAASGSYREHYLSAPGIVANTPVFLAVAVKADGDPYPIIGTRRGGGTIVGTLPTIQSDLGQELRIGATARPAPAASSFSNGSVWDVVWHVGSIPSDTVLNALAAGQRPHQISGFTPTYHWPMAALADTKDEESITGLATLRQAGSPAVVAPPVAPVPDEIGPLGFSFI